MLARPQNGAIPPPWYLVLHRHICAIPRFATYRAIIVRYPMKTSTKEFRDTIATSIARYEKYRCWASKSWRCGHRRMTMTLSGHRLERSVLVDLPASSALAVQASLPRRHLSNRMMAFLSRHTELGPSHPHCRKQKAPLPAVVEHCWGSEMPLKIVLLRPHNWSRLKPYY